MEEIILPYPCGPDVIRSPLYEGGRGAGVESAGKDTKVEAEA